jgi:hypothetical protein
MVQTRNPAGRGGASDGLVHAAKLNTSDHTRASEPHQVVRDCLMGWVASSAAGLTPDPRRIFLERAAARLMLVKAGEMVIETAIGGLVEAFEQLVAPHLCDCARETIARWERDYPPVKNKRPRAPPPTPQATIDAIMWCVRERGVPTLKEPANIDRLSRCDDAAKAQINARIKKMMKGAASNG